MRQRKEDKEFFLATPKQPKKLCECGRPIYDGRKNKCDACQAAIKKANAKRPYTRHNYAAKERLLATIAELEQAAQYQQWIVDETRKRIAALKAIAFEL